jgi:hypothetical protein
MRQGLFITHCECLQCRLATETDGRERGEPTWLIVFAVPRVSKGKPLCQRTRMANQYHRISAFPQLTSLKMSGLCLPSWHSTNSCIPSSHIRIQKYIIRIDVLTSAPSHQTGDQEHICDTECIIRCLPQFVHHWPSTENYKPAVHVRDFETTRGVLQMHP